MEHIEKKESGPEDNKEEVMKRIKELPAQERVKAIALNFHLEEKKKLDVCLEYKIEEFQQQFDLKAIPYYNAQNDLAMGTRPPTEDELTGIEKFLTDEEKSYYKGFLNTNLEDYWPKIMKTYFHDNTIVTEKDQEILKYLLKVEFKLYPPKHDFSLTFTFTENEHIETLVLTKKFIYGDSQKEADYPVRSEGTNIHWKEGKNVCLKQVSKKQKNKKTGASRTVNKQVKAESFFNLFESVQTFEGDEDLAEQMDKDIDLAKSFVESILPTQLELYLGIEPVEHEDDYEDMGDDDDDEEGEGDKDKDDDDSDEDDKKKKDKKKPHKNSGDDTKAKEGVKPECKQQ